MQKLSIKRQIILSVCLCMTILPSFSMSESSSSAHGHKEHAEKVSRKYILSNCRSGMPHVVVSALRAHGSLISEALSDKGKVEFRSIFRDSKEVKNKIFEVHHESHLTPVEALTNYLHEQGYMKEDYKLKCDSVIKSSDGIKIENWDVIKIENKKNPLLKYISGLGLSSRNSIRIFSHMNVVRREDLKHRLDSEQQLEEIEKAIEHRTEFKKIFIDPAYKDSEKCEMGHYLGMRFERIDHPKISGWIAKRGNVTLYYVGEKISTFEIEELKAKGYLVFQDHEAVIHSH